MMILLTAACYNNTIFQKEVVISGTVSLPEDDIEAVGTVQLRAYREWTGEGELRTPLLEIDSLKINSLGPYEWRIRIDRNRDEGLAVFGWLDRNNDGILCDLFSDNEPSGLLVTRWNSVEHSVQADIIFDQDCAGAESLYGDEAFVAEEEEDSGLSED